MSDSLRDRVRERLENSKNCNRRPNKLSTADRVRIAEMYADGETLSSLARMFGCSVPTIVYHVEKAAR